MLRSVRGVVVAVVFIMSDCSCQHPSSQPPATATPAVAVAPPAPRPAPERLTTDSPRATPNGTTFVAPAGWTLTVKPDLVLLVPPEPDSRVAIVDVKANNADQAAAGAWSIYQPASKRPVKLSTARPARQGWDARQQYEYQTSPNERAVISATVLRQGAAWTVLIVDATEPTFERRAAPIALIGDTLRPKGYVRESFAHKKAHAMDAERLKLLGEFIELGRRELRIPGVSLGVIDQGKVVFAGGFGVRELGKPTPVDADTLYMIASNTKGLTTLMLAKLVEAGKLRWDTPVVKVYPDFKLGSAATTNQVLIKHLVCACTGLPRQDYEWLFDYRKSAKATMELLGAAQPTSNFGEVYQYSNLLAAAAGFVGGATAEPQREVGAAYDAAMQELVFDPLGMKNSTFDFARALRGNYARPYGDDVDGKVAPVEMNLNYAILPLRPAAGMWSNVRDLLRYVQMELSGGLLPDGQRFISEQNLLARRAPQVSMGEDMHYGMGLKVESTWGVPVVHHTGSMYGYKSDVIFLPEQKIGVVLLMNGEHGWYYFPTFIRRLLEIIFDGRPEAAEEVMAQAREINERSKKERSLMSVPADAAAVGKLAAHYKSAELGTISVKRRGPATVFDFGPWSSTVASRQNDDGTISFLTIDPAYDGFNFVLAEKTDKHALVLRDAQHEYLYHAVP